MSTQVPTGVGHCEREEGSDRFYEDPPYPDRHEFLVEVALRLIFVRGDRGSTHEPQRGNRPKQQADDPGGRLVHVRRTRGDARWIVDRESPKDGSDPDNGIRRGEDANLHAARDAEFPSHNGPTLRQEHEECDVRDFVRQVEELGSGLKPCTYGTAYSRVRYVTPDEFAAIIKILIVVIMIQPIFSAIIH